MKFSVPFIPQCGKANCGPNALAMVLAYLGRRVPVERLEVMAECDSENGSYLFDLAAVAEELGFKTVLFYDFNHKGPPHRNYGSGYVSKSPTNLNERQSLVSNLRKKGLEVRNQRLDLNFLLSCLTNSSVPIVSIDRAVMDSLNENYEGWHACPVTGFNKSKVLVHDSDRAFRPIFSSVFSRALKAWTGQPYALIVSKPSRG